MRWVCATCLFLLATTARAQQDHDYCYFDDHPPGAVVTMDRYLPYLLDWYSTFDLAVAMQRRICGAMTEAELDYWRSVYLEDGCAPDSDLGRIFERVLTGKIIEIADLPYIGRHFLFARYLWTQEPEQWSAICARYREVTYPAPGAPDFEQAVKDWIRANMDVRFLSAESFGRYEAWRDGQPAEDGK